MSEREMAIPQQPQEEPKGGSLPELFNKLEKQDDPDEVKKNALIDQMAVWIDTRVIAEMIVSHCEQEVGDLTFENCKEIWLGTLENLGGGIGLARGSGESATM